jgi:hypothetical protein
MLDAEEEENKEIIKLIEDGNFTRRKCSKLSLIDSRYSRFLVMVVDRRGGKRAS